MQSFFKNTLSGVQKGILIFSSPILVLYVLSKAFRTNEHQSIWVIEATKENKIGVGARKTGRRRWQRWSEEQRYLHINVLELLTIKF